MKLQSIGKLLFFILAQGSLLSACASPAKNDRILLEVRKPVKIEPAVATFVDFCYGSAPSFDNVETKARSGSYKLTTNGWLEHSDFGISMVVRDHKDFKTCQFAFISNQPPSFFEEQMANPFNARELSKSDAGKLFQSQSFLARYQNPPSKIFIGKTTFNDNIPATLYGYIFDNPNTQEQYNSYGLLLQVARQ